MSIYISTHRGRIARLQARPRAPAETPGNGGWVVGLVVGGAGSATTRRVSRSSEEVLPEEVKTSSARCCRQLDT